MNHKTERALQGPFLITTLQLLLNAEQLAAHYQVFLPWQEFEQERVALLQPAVVATFLAPLL
jgi:hypothetical protein